MLAAEDLPMLVVVLDREAKYPAGPSAAVAFRQQRLEGGQIVNVSPLGQEQVRIQEEIKITTITIRQNVFITM